jgi:putative transposase
MERQIEVHRKQLALRLDNGSELASTAFAEWCAEQLIQLHFIQPGKPDQNALIERFNRTNRDEVLDAYVFDSLEQVREITESRLRESNEERPDDSLGRVPSLTFLPGSKLPAESSSEL